MSNQWKMMGAMGAILKWFVGPQESEKKICRCEVLVRQEAVFVLGLTETQHGVCLTSKPVTKLSQPVNPEELGRVVLETLNLFRSIAKHPSPEELKIFDEELLCEAGFSSWRKFSKDAKRIGVESEGNTLTATPSVAGPSAGYADITDLAITTILDPGSVGRAILEASTKCTTTRRF